MLPTQLVHEVTKGLRSYVTTGFETDTPFFKGMFSRFVETPEKLIKGPWLSMSLPFKQGSYGKDFFLDFETQFPPFIHQQLAWQRISSNKSARSTLVATGTGSGKTECFLYPLLDHCFRHGEKGIKAIIIYPMNALATDQAKRFAKTVNDSTKLKGKLRVGLFVGGEEERTVKKMTRASVITDKNVLRENPPDILLTNYKMLDFLLIRPKDRAIWRFNKPETLRYLIVDELHTFDGAQGTDLACLIRRLRGRLLEKEEADSLICVGTSATLGTESGAADLREYAAHIFRSEFDRNSVITEQRQSINDFLTAPIEYMLQPQDNVQEILNPEIYNDAGAWLDAQNSLFFPGQDPVDWKDESSRQLLGDNLKRQLLFNNLLRLLAKTPLKTLDDLAQELSRTLPAGSLRENTKNVLNSLCALVAMALGPDKQPLVNLRLQLWLREMRRMVSPLMLADPDEGEDPQAILSFADDLKSGEKELALPLVQCNHCNGTAWLTRIPEGESTISTDLRAIYQAWFGHDPEAHVLIPLEEEDELPASRGLEHFCCQSCGHLQGETGKCSACGEGPSQRVFKPDLRKQRRIAGLNRLLTEHNCGICGTADSLMVFGARSATLSSVLIQHLYASVWNDDKKLITFSDSVQDAAHRAGFFGARTWLNLVRLALVQAMPAQEIGLTEFNDRFVAYWRDPALNPSAMADEEFVAQFIAPNMLWYRDYAALIESEEHKIPAGSNLVSDVCKRLEWEVFAEFGYRSSIGRSLEQTGSVAMGIKADSIDVVVSKLLETLQEHEGIQNLETGEVRELVVGLLLHLKQNGAVDQRFAGAYIESGGKNFLFTRQSYLPAFAPSSRAPVYLTDATSRTEFERLFLRTGQSWPVKWMFRTLGTSRLLSEGIETTLIPRVLNALAHENILNVHESNGSNVWALNPEQLYLSRDVAVLETGKARDRIFVPVSMLSVVEHLPSLLASDPGHYGQVDIRSSWLSDIYQKGEIKRINAKEHTGLLARDERQQIERDFIDGRHPWSCNLLSATPTLEMGIDIGDLSSLLLCSVPPAQANYLQRVGRAGRRDGNAFAMTVAGGSPHDLYFYADPMLMMAGDVEPPGVFLNAYAVISRQLTAYCMDQWVDTGIDESAIPRRMKKVLDDVGSGALDQFPYNFTSFVNANTLQLLDGFIALFEDELSDLTQSRLKAFINGEGDEDGLEMRLVKRLHELLDQRTGFIKKISDLKNALGRLQRLPQDEATQLEIEAVERERGSLQAMLRSLNSRQPLNYLTDEGLIPNYAFPEAGVTLRSVIYAKRQAPTDGESTYENWVFEYERPGAAAIRELIPNNRFYAGGRRVEIEQVDLELSDIELWRFCQSCSHSSRIHEDPEVSCPKCGDGMWADNGQLVEMVRLRQVMANSSDRQSRIGDDSDDRDTSFHVRQMLTDFAPESVMQAYQIKNDELPFGFEFVRKVNFREVNFGEYGASGDERSIAGVSVARPGFTLCRFCGMVQDQKELKKGGAQKHSYLCQAKKPHPEDENNLVHCLYLYREFDSEALRILLPMSAMEEGDRSLNSFIAGLQLGLKLKYGGKIDHLKVMNYTEPASATSAEKNFLMVYDSVPGGTGYLQQLMETPDLLLEVFQFAHNHMRRCSCNQEAEKDGCYRCLYAYRNSHGMETTSRDQAISLFGLILENAEKIEEVATIDDIEVNPLLDSELETRFIGAIRSARIVGLEIQIQQQVVNGKPGYFLRINEELYTIEPQVLLSESDGVVVPSKPDFMIRSARASGEGPKFLPIALFMDGFKYHKHTVAEDSAKRLAIVKSGRHHVWSLTWDDIQAQYAKTKLELGNAFSHGLNDSMRTVQDALKKKLGVSSKLFQLPLRTPFEQLLEFLADPNVEQLQGLGMARALSWFDQSKMVEPAWVEEVKSKVQGVAPSGFSEELENLGEVACGGFEKGRLQLDCILPLMALKEVSPERTAISILIDDEMEHGEEVNKQTWHEFLSAYNLLQFLPLTLFVSGKGVKAGLYESISWDVHQHLPGFSHASSDEIQMVIDATDPSLADGLLLLAEKGVELPEVGYEFLNGQSEIVSEAELAWPGLKIAGVMEGEATKIHGLGAGWKVISLDEKGQWANSIMKIKDGDV